MILHVYYTSQPITYFFSIYLMPYLLLRILLTKIHIAHRFPYETKWAIYLNHFACMILLLVMIPDP